MVTFWATVLGKVVNLEQLLLCAKATDILAQGSELPEMIKSWMKDKGILTSTPALGTSFQSVVAEVVKLSGDPQFESLARMRK